MLLSLNILSNVSLINRCNELFCIFAGDWFKQYNKSLIFHVETTSVCSKQFPIQVVPYKYTFTDLIPNERLVTKYKMSWSLSAFSVAFALFSLPHSISIGMLINAIIYELLFSVYITISVQTPSL